MELILELVMLAIDLRWYRKFFKQLREQKKAADIKLR